MQRTLSPAAPGGTAGFDQELRHALRQAPWLTVSLAFHALLYLLMLNVVWSSTTPEVQRAIHASLDPSLEPDLLQPLDPPDPVKENPDEPDLVDPVVTQADDFVPLRPVDDSSLTKNDYEFETSGQPVIGAGGGRLGGPGGGGGPGAGGRGGPVASQRAVNAGLAWLSRHQDPAGHWDADDFSNQCESNLCSGRGQALNDVGVTGLSLLAFLGAGHAPKTQPHGERVQRGLRALNQVQDRETGCFGAMNGESFLYGHSLATLAMIEAYHITRALPYRDSAQRGLDFIARARNPYKAWRYAYPPDGSNDVSVTGWMLFALFAGQDAGLAVDASAIDQAMSYVEEMTDPTTGRTGYATRGSRPAREPEDVDRWPAERSESMTAIATLLRVFHAGDDADPAMLRRSADLLVQALPDHDEGRGSIDYYYWYYGTYAMYQIAGRPWDQWQRHLQRAVVESQRQDGDESGSWDPQVDPWGDRGGRVYSTAINTLTLEVYYRYDWLLGLRTGARTPRPPK